MRTPEDIDQLHKDLRLVLNTLTPFDDESEMCIAGALAALDWVRGVSNRATRVLENTRAAVIRDQASAN
jgi:hypothetical protein